MEIEAIKQQLLEHKAELERESVARKQESQPVALDQTTVGRLSRMDALQNQAMAQEKQRRRDIELMRIDAALSRIETGEYGCCVSCGEAIGEERLIQNPAFPTCIECARAAH